MPYLTYSIKNFIRLHHPYFFHPILLLADCGTENLGLTSQFILDCNDLKTFIFL